MTILISSGIDYVLFLLKNLKELEVEELDTGGDKGYAIRMLAYYYYGSTYGTSPYSDFIHTPTHAWPPPRPSDLPTVIATTPAPTPDTLDGTTTSLSPVITPAIPGTGLTKTFVR